MGYHHDGDNQVVLVNTTYCLASYNLDDEGRFRVPGNWKLHSVVSCDTKLGRVHVILEKKR